MHASMGQMVVRKRAETTRENRNGVKNICEDSSISVVFIYLVECIQAMDPVNPISTLPDLSISIHKPLFTRADAF